VRYHYCTVSVRGHWLSLNCAFHQLVTEVPQSGRVVGIVVLGVGGGIIVVELLGGGDCGYLCWRFGVPCRYSFRGN